MVNSATIKFMIPAIFSYGNGWDPDGETAVYVNIRPGVINKGSACGFQGLYFFSTSDGSSAYLPNSFP